jgi:hypothetical protein
VALEKQPAAQAGTVTVSFVLPPDVGAESAELLGDFTDWTPIAMDTDEHGGHTISLDLRSGAAYRFRYLLDGERWENDWAADDYAANDYGSHDSIVDLTAELEPTTPSKRARSPRKASGATTKRSAVVRRASSEGGAARKEPARKKSNASGDE